MSTDRVMQIYLAGLKRLEEAPDYKFLNVKKRRSHGHGNGRVPVRGIREVKAKFTAKHRILSDL